MGQLARLRVLRRRHTGQGDRGLCWDGGGGDCLHGLSLRADTTGHVQLQETMCSLCTSPPREWWSHADTPAAPEKPATLWELCEAVHLAASRLPQQDTEHSTSWLKFGPFSSARYCGCARAATEEAAKNLASLLTLGELFTPHSRHTTTHRNSSAHCAAFLSSYYFKPLL